MAEVLLGGRLARKPAAVSLLEGQETEGKGSGPFSASECLSTHYHRIGTVPDGALQIANFRPDRDRARDP